MDPGRLVERQDALDRLHAVVTGVGDDGGRVVLVPGEAGVGKTALVRAAAGALAGRDVLIGGCDALSTPRPLGPLLDLAAEMDGSLPAALAQAAPPHAVFSAVLGYLRTAPRVMVLEDVHWADDGTLDLIRYLGRRIRTTSSVLVLTYRDVEVDAAHPLREVVGELVRTGATTRLELAPLSPAGVAALVGDLPVDAGDLYEKTGGNAFFVTEVLAQPERPIPDNVRDAVLGRTVGLSPPARTTLHLMSCVPAGLDDAAFAGLRGPNAEAGLRGPNAGAGLGLPGEALDELVGHGLLVHEHGRVRFRHELARLTIADSVSEPARRDLNARLFTLLEPAGDHALLVHLAERAGRSADVRALAPRAAADAARAGAHHQAAAFLTMALADATGDERAELLEALAYERYFVDEMAAGIDALNEALALRRAAGATARAAADLRWLSRLEWFCADRAAAERHATEAVRLAQESGDERELGFAQGQVATIAMTAGDPVSALDWGARALAAAERVDDDELRATVLTTVGMARLMAGDETGVDRIRESSRVAARSGLDEHAARALTNLSFFLVEARRLPEASDALEEGMRFTSDRDMDTFHLYSLGARARMRVLRGQWTAAWDDASAVLRTDPAPLNAMWPRWVRGILAVRRGDPDPVPPLEEAWRIATGFAEAYRLVPIAAALAEHEWLTGEDVGGGPRLAGLAEQLVGTVGRWQAGEAAAWLRRLGRPVPEGLDLAGTLYDPAPGADTDEVARAWRDRGLPYEELLVLAGSDRTDHLQAALERALDLGATTTAGWLRTRLRERGVASPARGPRAATQANPAGLTARQVDVVRLLAQHLTNAEIAERLFISEKTAGHHVSAILAKLNVASRRDAARLAGDLGLVTVATPPG
jgi:DNA-binding CsgD family transcriptional regulator